MEKLTAMRVVGMVDALKAQEQDPAARELSFLERLGLLVDQQWSWRENQALARRLHSAKLKGACVEEKSLLDVTWQCSQFRDQILAMKFTLFNDDLNALGCGEASNVQEIRSNGVTRSRRKRMPSHVDRPIIFLG